MKTFYNTQNMDGYFPIDAKFNNSVCSITFSVRFIKNKLICLSISFIRFQIKKPRKFEFRTIFSNELNIRILSRSNFEVSFAPKEVFSKPENSLDFLI